LAGPLRESPSAARRPPESVSRFKRKRSVLSSVAVWQRSERSFSSAFDRIRPSSAGSAELSCVTGGGSRFRIASKTTADVSP
jgi:hypothetical protein